MRRFDFTFTEEERVAYLKHTKKPPYLGALFEVLLASGTDENPAEPLYDALSLVIDEFDTSHSGKWVATFEKANTYLLAEDKQVPSLLFTARRKRDNALIPFFFFNQMCHGLAIHFDPLTYRLSTFSVLSQEEVESYKTQDEHN